MKRYILSLLLLLIPALGVCADVVKPTTVKPVAIYTQKDFALKLISQFGWSGGLPTEPADRDFLTILSGKRTFRYEAENAYNEVTDRVTVRQTTVFGPFTGKGWIMGVSEPTISNFTFLMPIKGDYTFKAAIKGNGFVWNVDGKEFKADSNTRGFKEVEIGTLSLKAGVVKIKVTIPADGGIDSFTFAAPDYSPAQPFIGWRFRDPLTAGRMAEIGVYTANRMGELPDTKVGLPATINVVDVVPPSETINVTDAQFLGKFVAPRWLRADYRGGITQVNLKIAETGYYGIQVNAMGNVISGAINGTPFSVPGKPYLKPTWIGYFRLEAGDNLLSMNIPSNGGIDTIEFTRKDTSPEAFLMLADVKGPVDRPVTAAEAAEFIAALQKNTTVRK